MYCEVLLRHLHTVVPLFVERGHGFGPLGVGLQGLKSLPLPVELLVDLLFLVFLIHWLQLSNFCAAGLRNDSTHTTTRMSSARGARGARRKWGGGWGASTSLFSFIVWGQQKLVDEDALHVLLVVRACVRRELQRVRVERGLVEHDEQRGEEGGEERGEKARAVGKALEFFYMAAPFAAAT